MSIRPPFALAFLLAVSTVTLRAAEFVIMVSVDGFRPAAIEQLRAAGELEHLARLQQEGVWTHNARSDYGWTDTVPNHVTMVTGRAVDGADGHNYTNNGSIGAADTLHANKGNYLASVFDVAHDHGLTTALHRSKSKLAIIDQSYDAAGGAPDVTGDDDGRAKIDIVRYSVTGNQAGSLIDQLKVDLIDDPVHLTFLHLVDPDPVGHSSGWGSPEYLEAVRRVDAYLGRLLHLVEANEPYAGRTTIILTADHGGLGSSHTDASDPENYVVPFYVWGADVPATGDLYAINRAVRTDPGAGRPEYGAGSQPIRNGDIGNLALDLLGLTPIPGSTINTTQDLRVSVAAQDDVRATLRQLETGAMQLRWAISTPATVQISDDLSQWMDPAGTWPSDQRYWIDPDSGISSRFYRVVFE